MPGHPLLGSDTALPGVSWLYLFLGVSVALLTLYRIMLAWQKRRDQI